MVAAATERGIPHIRLNDGNLVQLGYGAAQRRIWTAESDFTSAIAEGIASDKELTKGLLASCGLPIPEGRLVHSPEQAWQAAQEIGLPGGLKPSGGNHRPGGTPDFPTPQNNPTPQPPAAAEPRRRGAGNKRGPAARGGVASTPANARSTVAELIDSQINADPRRG